MSCCSKTRGVSQYYSIQLATSMSGVILRSSRRRLDQREEPRGTWTNIIQIVSVCVSLGEYPTIRYYNPRVASHEASVLCSHLARFVQDELDQYAQYNQEFPPPSNRPRGVLYITDRTMDLYSPLLHEFTYQAMAHDLLPIADGDKVTYQLTTNQGTPAQEVKDMEISEKDKIWVENRHLHMKDLLGKLADDFNKFRAQNPQFAET